MFSNTCLLDHDQICLAQMNPGFEERENKKVVFVMKSTAGTEKPLNISSLWDFTIHISYIFFSKI